MFSIQHCSVAAICVASVCQNHSHCNAKSQPGDTIPRRVIGTLGHDRVTPHGLNGGFLGLGPLALHDEQIQWIRLRDT